MASETKKACGPMERRRSEILETATKVFARRGYPNTDVQEIADKVGVGKGTVYRHFGTKKRLFLAAVEKGVRELVEAILKRIASCSDPVTQIKVGLVEYFEFFDRHKDLVEIFIQERSEFRGASKSTYFTYRDNNISVLENILRTGVKRGLFRRVNVKRSAEVLSDLTYGTVIAHLMKGSRDRLVSKAEDIMDIYLNGIRETSARKDG